MNKPVLLIVVFPLVAVEEMKLSDQDSCLVLIAPIVYVIRLMAHLWDV